MLIISFFIGIVPFLVKASISLDEGVATTLLQLLQCALCGSEVSKGPQPQGSASGTSPAKQKKTKDKDKDKDKNEGNNFNPLLHQMRSSILLLSSFC